MHNPWSDPYGDHAILQFCEWCGRAKSMYCGACAKGNGKQATHHTPITTVHHTFGNAKPFEHWICHWCIKLINISMSRHMIDYER